jgi:hypothetical protein
MARTSANAIGPTATSSILEQLEYQLQKSFREFHEHSKTCRGCRNPLEQYRQKRDLCEIGGALAAQITKLLYRKAEHVPEGAFSVEYKQGWEAVDGLIRIIAHYNQGENTTKIRDIRQPRSVPIPQIEYRGSGWDEDMSRRQHAGERSYSHRRSPSGNARNNLEVYGDPRNSFLDVNTGRTQAETSPVGSVRSLNSSNPSNKSVHFDTHVRVREFEKEK